MEAGKWRCIGIGVVGSRDSWGLLASRAQVRMACLIVNEKAIFACRDELRTLC